MNRLKELREAAQLTQAQLGEKVGLTHSAVCRHETGSREMSFHDLKRYAQALGCTIDDIRGV